MYKKISFLFLISCSCNSDVIGSSTESSSSEIIEDSTSSTSSTGDDESSTSSTSFDSSTGDIEVSSTTEFSSSTGYVAICGNKIVENEEECDDGNLEQLDQCSNSCEKPRRIFVTSQKFFGDELDSVFYADDLCDDLIQKVNIEGTYKAWLSEKEDTLYYPAMRFEASKKNFRGIYILLDGTIVTENGWEDLTKGNLKTNINITEKVHLVENLYPWTNTYSNGTPAWSDCNGWTTALGYFGHQGSTDHSNNFWSSWDVEYCVKDAPIFCVEDY